MVSIDINQIRTMWAVGWITGKCFVLFTVTSINKPKISTRRPQSGAQDSSRALPIIPEVRSDKIPRSHVFSWGGLREGCWPTFQLLFLSSKLNKIAKHHIFKGEKVWPTFCSWVQSWQNFSIFLGGFDLLSKFYSWVKNWQNDKVPYSLGGCGDRDWRGLLSHFLTFVSQSKTDKMTKSHIIWGGGWHTFQLLFLTKLQSPIFEVGCLCNKNEKCHISVKREIVVLTKFWSVQRKANWTIKSEQWVAWSMKFLSGAHKDGMINCDKNTDPTS